MTTTKTQRPTSKPVSRPVGGAQQSTASAKDAKNDAAIKQLWELQRDLDSMEAMCRDLETKFKAVDLSDFPQGDRSRMERQIELAQASSWATLISITRAIEHAANGLKDASMSPRDLRRKTPGRREDDGMKTPLGLSLEGLVPFDQTA